MFLIRNALILTLFLTSQSFAKTCLEILEDSSKSDSFASIIEKSILPLDVITGLRELDFEFDGNIKSLSPSAELPIYIKTDRELLADKGFSIKGMMTNYRVVELDYGFVVLKRKELYTWQKLENVISNPSWAKKFIDDASLSEKPLFYGMTPKALEWLQKSRQSHMEAQSLAQSSPNADKVEYNFFKPMQRVIEYRNLTRKEQFLSFPFDSELEDGSIGITEKNAQVVLTVLSRHYILSNLYVKDHSGAYIKLSEVLDRDSLFLLSRFPQLFPIFPLLMGGQFEIDVHSNFVGSSDYYILANKFIGSESVPFPSIERLKPNLNLSKSYMVNVMGHSDENELSVKIEAIFTLNFTDDDLLLEELSDDFIDSIYIEKAIEMQAFLVEKTRIFNEVTGYNLPVGNLVIATDIEDLYGRDYKISFGNRFIKSHILAAFYIFLKSQF